MDPTEQAVDQTLRIALTGVEYALRISGEGTKNIAAMLLSIASTSQKTKGKARLQSLLKSGKELKVFHAKTSELASFAKEAKLYGVVYAVIKGAGAAHDGHVDILVKAEDAAKINRIIERLEYARLNTTAILVEAEQSLTADDKDATEKGESQNDAAKLLDELLGKGDKDEGVPKVNPTQGQAESPNLSEPSSKTDGHQDRTFAKSASKSDGHQSVKARIEEKRANRTSAGIPLEGSVEQSGKQSLPKLNNSKPKTPER